MSGSAIKTLQLELEDVTALCEKLNSIGEALRRRCESSQQELDALTQAVSALKSDEPQFAAISARVADMTAHQQRCAREQSDVQSKLRQCEQQKRELQQRIDDMSAAP